MFTMFTLGEDNKLHQKIRNKNAPRTSINHIRKADK